MDTIKNVEQNQNKNLTLDQSHPAASSLQRKVNKVLKSLLSAGIVAGAVQVNPVSARQSISREKESVAIQSWQSVFNSGTIIGTSKQVADQKTVFIRGYNDIPYQIVEGASGRDVIELSIHSLDSAQVKKVTQSAARNIKDKTGVVVNFVTNQEKAPQDMRVLATIATESSLTRESAVLLSHAFLRQTDIKVSEAEFPDIETYIEHKPLVEKTWGIAQTQGREITSVQEKILLSLYRTHGSATALARFAEMESDIDLMAKEIDVHFAQSTQSLNSARRGTNYNNIGDIELFFDELGLILYDEKQIFEALVRSNVKLSLDPQAIDGYLTELDDMISVISAMRVPDQDKPRFIASSMQYLTTFLQNSKRWDEYYQEFVSTNKTSLAKIRNTRSHASKALSDLLEYVKGGSAPARKFSSFYSGIQKNAIVEIGGDANSIRVAEKPKLREGAIEDIAQIIMDFVEQEKAEKAIATTYLLLEKEPERKDELKRYLVTYFEQRAKSWVLAHNEERFAIFNVLGDIFDYPSGNIVLGEAIRQVYQEDIESGRYKYVKIGSNHLNHIRQNTYVMGNDYTGHQENIYATTLPTNLPAGWRLMKSFSGSYIFSTEYSSSLSIVVDNPFPYRIGQLVLDINGGIAHKTSGGLRPQKILYSIKINGFEAGQRRVATQIVEHSSPLSALSSITLAKKPHVVVNYLIDGAEFQDKVVMTPDQTLFSRYLELKNISEKLKGQPGAVAKRSEMNQILYPEF